MIPEYGDEYFESPLEDKREHVARVEDGYAEVMEMLKSTSTPPPYYIDDTRNSSKLIRLELLVQMIEQTEILPVHYFYFLHQELLADPHYYNQQELEESPKLSFQFKSPHSKGIDHRVS